MSRQEQRENMIVMPSLTDSARKALTGGCFTLGDWPDDRWWESFGHSQLNALVESALEHNPTLQAVQERISYAAQEALIFRSKLFPFVSFDGEDEIGYLSKNGLIHTLNPSLPLHTNFVKLLLNLNYEIDIWGKNRNLYQAAIGKTRAEIAESNQVQLMITSAVAQTFFALKVNLYRKYLYEQIVQVRQRMYALQFFLNESALVSELVPSFSYEMLQEAKKALCVVDEEVALNRHLLNRLVGRGPDAELEFESVSALDLVRIEIPESLSLDLLSRRPDVMAAIWRAQALAHEVGAAIADFYPSLNIKALLGLDSLEYSKVFQASSIAVSATPAIHLPIFTAGAIRAKINAKKASFNQAIFDYNQTLLQSTQEVADVLSVLESVGARLECQSRIVGQARFRFDLTELNYYAGLDNMLEVYAIEDEWLEKSLVNADLMFSQYAAAISLIKALGGGYDEKNTPDLLDNDSSAGCCR
ncbi:MAG TPA: efflux transporter outer membrane subunit [Chlamydiales bacterium]|nr:efflux transporter outer membrane subunit [Chlamydiales bacterium]HPE85208.1 efflux transporter outer membrane subunit [Chlamydiales bacterium]